MNAELIPATRSQPGLGKNRLGARRDRAETGSLWA
jgi:hypothetical protein